MRGEGKVSRGLNLSVFLVSNELLEVDLRLDSRIQSAMSGEGVFFAPYAARELELILAPRLEDAFREGALPEDVFEYGVRRAADRWGDARKALTLFRHAGETADERELGQVTAECIDANVETTEKATTVEKLERLPLSHTAVLAAATLHRESETGAIVQPVTTQQIAEALQRDAVADDHRLGERAIREVLTDLETMGLVETWIESRGREGRVKQIETTFDPEWVWAAQTQSDLARLLAADAGGEDAHDGEHP